ncbi:MAG: group III truncated hemoglobin [Opitutus sp.]
MKDIENESDVRLLVDKFYESVRQDDLLNPIFSDFAHVDWAQHLPRMYAFWNNLILAQPGYSGSPFPPHTVLPVQREHFVRWLELFRGNVDRHFSGIRAQRAKDAAASIAHTFALRLKLIDPVAGKML